MPLGAFQFDPDEGLRLSQLILYQQDYRLYSDIPSDQPPLFTIMLDWWFRFWDFFLASGYSDHVLLARLFTLSCAVVLVWTFFQIVQTIANTKSAVFATLLLLFSCNFLRLSLSVMIGLPCLTFALLSIYIWTYFRYRKKDPTSQDILLYPFISGFLLACSLMTKMFTIFLVPLVSIFWLSYSFSENKKRSFLLVFFFLLGGISLLLISSIFWISVNDISRFFQFHLSDDLKSHFTSENSVLTVISFYLQDFDYVIVCLWGISSVSFRKKDWVKIPISWLVIVTILLATHKPVWYHHYLLISIPLCWLTALGIETINKELKANFFRQPAIKKKISWATLTLAFMGLAFGIKMYFFSQNNADIMAKSDDAYIVLEQIVKYQDQTQWLFTDMPMYGVRSNINVPPELSVISRKTLASGKITPTSMMQVIKKYQPEQFVIARFSKLENKIKDYLDENCERYVYRNATHFIRKDIL